MKPALVSCGLLEVVYKVVQLEEDESFRLTSHIDIEKPPLSEGGVQEISSEPDLMTKLIWVTAPAAEPTSCRVDWVDADVPLEPTA